jgi:plasmid stabilization system protein ParE
MAAEGRYAPEAEDDVSEGYSFYVNRATRRGEEFLRAVDARISASARSPAAHQRIYKSYRRAVVRRFPYMVIYDYENGVVTVYSVFHTSQDPKKWRERLP